MKIYKTIRDKSHGKNYSYYDHITEIHDDKYIYNFLNKDLYKKIKEIYNKIKDIKNIQEMIFENGLIYSPIYNNPLVDNEFSKDEKNIIKKQLIDF